MFWTKNTEVTEPFDNEKLLTSDNDIDDESEPDESNSENSYLGEVTHEKRLKSLVPSIIIFEFQEFHRLT